MFISVAAGTTLTNLDDGQNGQVVTILSINNGTSITDGGNFVLAGNWAPDGKDDIITLRYNGVTWIELSRSDN